MNEKNIIFFIITNTFNKYHYLKDKNILIISYSQDLIKFCKEKKFKLILYEPFMKVFLDSNLNIINEIKIPDLYTNLLEEDILSFCNDNSQLYGKFLQRKTKLNLTTELIELTKKVKNIKKQKMRISEVINYIGKREFVNSNFLPTPKNECFFLFYKNDHDKFEDLNKFYCFYNNNSKFMVYDFSNKKNIECEYICDYY